MVQDTNQNKVKLEETKEKDSEVSLFLFHYKYPKVTLKNKKMQLQCLYQSSPNTTAQQLFELYA